jgi:hypothetical protein
MVRTSIRKLLRLPSPSDLGWSSSEFSEAMPIRAMATPPDRKCWEDYEEYLVSTYPVRGFLAITLTNAAMGVWWDASRPFKDAWYWLVSHTARRHHMLDLRQPKPGYRFGWLDSDSKMEYALFNILNDYVKNEMPHFYLPSEEDIAKEPNEWGQRKALQRQRENGLEVLAIHRWWNVERPALEKMIDERLTEWNGIFNQIGHDKAVEHAKFQAIREPEEQLAKELEEMMIRLVKVRTAMWT